MRYNLRVGEVIYPFFYLQGVDSFLEFFIYKVRMSKYANVKMR